jgi:predicted RNA-binding protein associated with RNAse of E/G family
MFSIIKICDSKSNPREKYVEIKQIKGREYLRVYTAIYDGYRL